MTVRARQSQLLRSTRRAPEDAHSPTTIHRTVLVGSAVTATAMAAAGAALLLAEPDADRTSMLFVPAFVVMGLLSMLIIRRAPANAVGWLMFTLAGMAGASVFVEGYIAYRGGALVGAAWLALVATAVFDTVAPLLLASVLLLFPTGRLPSPRWRPVPWSLIGLTVVAAVGYGVQPRTPEYYGSLPNPLAVAGSEPLLAVAEIVVSAVVVGGMVAAVAALIVRYRRASGAERAQIRWVGLAAAVLAIELVFAIVMQAVVDADALQGIELVGALLFLVAFATLPVSITIAITRYRLYDIDRLLSRTVTYAVMTAVLAAAYAGSVVAMRVVVTPFAGGSNLTVAASTLVVAALFGPVRRRVQAVVDRRFNRARYDAQRTVAAFGGRLRDEVHLDEVAADLCGVVGATVQPASVSLWLRPEGGAAR